MYAVKDKVFFVTGGASGIGAEIILDLLREDAKHVAVLDVNTNLGKALENELKTKYGAKKISFFECDVSTDLDAVYDKVLSNFGYIDVVINNAGILRESLNTYQKEIAVNVTALITSSLKAYNLMRKDRAGNGGTIVNISSIAALAPAPTLPVYAATKAAVLHFDICLGDPEHFDRTGVRVITLCFGCTDTDLLKEGKFETIDEECYKSTLQRLPAYTFQKAQSAAKGVVDAYKKGESGSVWLATHDRPVKDITETVKKAYDLTSQLVFE